MAFVVIWWTQTFFVAVFRTATITTNSVGEWQMYSMSPLKKMPLNCITISTCLCVFIRSPVYKRWLIIMIYAVLFAENQVLFSECFLCGILQPRDSLIIDRVKPDQVTFMWTCWFNLLHSAITFSHFFTVSLGAQNFRFQKILSSAMVCFCLSDWSCGFRPITRFLCSSFFMF